MSHITTATAFHITTKQLKYKMEDLYREMNARKNLSKQELIARMNDWASSGWYEQDMVKWKVVPLVSKVAVAFFEPLIRSSLKVIDIAAGTGFVAKDMLECGFKHIDAVDASVEMKKVAMSRNLYKNYSVEFIDGTRMDISTDAYDCATISGGISYYLLPVNSLFEVVRLVKPGGVIIFDLDDNLENETDEYRDRLVPLFEKFKTEGIWELVQHTKYPNVADNVNGCVCIYKVLVSEAHIPQLPVIKRPNEL